MKKKIVTFAAGDLIFAQGAKTDWVYHLLGGRVSLWAENTKLMDLEPIHILGLEGCYNRHLLYSVTAMAESDARLLAYDADQIPDVLFANPQLGRQTLESLTQQLEFTQHLFAQGGSQDQPEVFFAGEIQAFGPGEAVIREDEETTELYRIISASEGLEVSKQGKVITVIRKPGEFFGEMAAVTKAPRTATITSLGETVLEVYPGNTVSRVIEDYPDVAMRIITDLSQRLAETNRLLTGKDTDPA